MEYELPLNFNFDPNLTSTLSALELLNGEFLGFLFLDAADKTSWNNKMTEVSAMLTKNQAEVNEIKKVVKDKMNEEMSHQLADTIKVDELLSGTN